MHLVVANELHSRKDRVWLVTQRVGGRVDGGAVRRLTRRLPVRCVSLVSWPLGDVACEAAAAGEAGRAQQAAATNSCASSAVMHMS